jgi:hypothetical protein
MTKRKLLVALLGTAMVLLLLSGSPSVDFPQFRGHPNCF